MHGAPTSRRTHEIVAARPPPSAGRVVCHSRVDGAPSGAVVVAALVAESAQDAVVSRVGSLQQALVLPLHSFELGVGHVSLYRGAAIQSDGWDFDW